LKSGSSCETTDRLTDGGYYSILIIDTSKSSIF